MSEIASLHVFLCHASQDKPRVRELYDRLKSEGWIDPWLDVEKLFPGQDWRIAIEEAVEISDNVIICLSNNSVTKEGYVQKEMRYAQEISLEKPEGTIFLIPLRLEECEVPRGLRFFHWTDYFGAWKEQSYQILLKSLRMRLEEKIRKVEEERAYLETLERARLEEEEHALRKAEELARKRAEQKARREARIRAQKEKAERERLAMEELARLQSEERTQQEKEEERQKEVEELSKSEARELDGSEIEESAHREKKQDEDKGEDVLLQEQAEELEHPEQGDAEEFRYQQLEDRTHKGRAHVSIEADELIQEPSNENASQPIPAPLAAQIIEAIQDTHQIWGGIEFVKVSKGKFVMGSQDRNPLAFLDEKPSHHVDIAYDYWIGRFLITHEQYNQFVASAKYSKKRFVARMYNPSHPVVGASWKDVQSYLKWLNADNQVSLPPGLTCRLPTEAEWEKAARGIDGREWPWGNVFDHGMCNSSESGIGTTTPVGSYSPWGDSPYGCADMSGNIWEWTQSLYRPYPYNPKDGREILRGSGFRVVRGGSFYREMMLVRCAYRKGASVSNFVAGFRVVLAPPVNQ